MKYFFLSSLLLFVLTSCQTQPPLHQNTMQNISKNGIQDIESVEKGKSSTLKFSLPILAASKYQRDLIQETVYTMLIAYSREDDFEHHSMMRTSVEVKL